MEGNKSKFTKIFTMLSASNNNTITFNDVQKFCKVTNVFPVSTHLDISNRFQDLVTVNDLKKILNKVSVIDNDKSSASSHTYGLLSYEQFV